MEAYKFSSLNVLVLSQGMFFVFVRIADYSDEEYRVFNQSTQFHFISKRTNGDSSRSNRKNIQTLACFSTRFQDVNFVFYCRYSTSIYQ